MPSSTAIRAALYASFPWYDLAEMHAATDELWKTLATFFARMGLEDVPTRLDRERPHGTDHAGTCLFTQTCGYPLFTTARGHFTVLGAPCYGVPGCNGWLHRSYVVVRDEAPVSALYHLRGMRFAINEPDSNSGMNLPRLLFAPLARGGRFFAETIVTGSHEASAAHVSDGRADAAALDCVTLALLRRYRPDAVARLRIVAETVLTPAPPLVTSCNTTARDVAALRLALREFMRDRRYAELRDALFLADINCCDEDTYDVVMDCEREAQRLGYPDLT